jgi:hypothetical protein
MNRIPLDRALGPIALALTVILSIMMIRSPGTPDVSLYFLNWTEVVYQNGLIAGYSMIINGLHADYPPLSYALLYCARALGDAIGISALLSFKVSLLTFQLISAFLVLILSGSYWIAAAFNASLILSGVGLGYMDVYVAPSLIAAFWAFRWRRNVSGLAFFLIACLTKWQPLIVAPFVAIYLLGISNIRSIRDAVRTSLFRRLSALVGFTIALLGALFGLDPARSLWAGMNHPHISGYALNLPWIVGSISQLLFSPLVESNSELTYLMPRYRYLLPFKFVFAVTFVTIVFRAIRRIDSVENCLLFSIIGSVTYFLLNSGVHENHLFAAVLLAYLLMIFTRSRENWALATLLAAMFNTNLFVFYGVNGTALQNRVVGVDISLILAILCVFACTCIFLYGWNVMQPRTEKFH